MFEGSESHPHRLAEDFVSAAMRALAAGFEWLELHLADGYLAHEFYSPLANHRTDGDGGNFDNRMRFLLETFAADLVVLAREMLRDPYWPYHAAQKPGLEKAAEILPVQYARAVKR